MEKAVEILMCFTLAVLGLGGIIVYVLWRDHCGMPAK